MKTSHAIGLVIAAVLITVAIEESRISSLTQRIQTVEKSAIQNGTQTARMASSETLDEPVKTKSARDRVESSTAKEPDATQESFAKTARKMFDSPAGKAMMNQGAKMAVAMMYQDFIDGLNLAKEEADYFKNLLGKEVTDQQELGMKMMGATPEERKALMDEMTKRGADSEAEINRFLNSEEDVKAFKDYKSRLPERQQLDGIRSAMTGKGAPIDAATEAKLVDAMYRARTEAKGPDLSGPGAMDELAKGNIVESYEKSWDAQQEVLRGETVKFLSTDQMTAFQEHQKQTKEMQLMGLKMAQKMMPELMEKVEDTIVKPETKVDFK